MGQPDIRNEAGVVNKAWPAGAVPARQRWRVGLLILALHVGGWWVVPLASVGVASPTPAESMARVQRLNGLSQSLVMVNLPPLSRAVAGHDPQGGLLGPLVKASSVSAGGHLRPEGTLLALPSPDHALAPAGSSQAEGADRPALQVAALGAAVVATPPPSVTSAVADAKPEPAVRLTQQARPAPGNALPRYPEAAREDGLEGTVRLLVDIASDGTVKAVRWAARSGVPLLDQAARDAVRLWRFLPAWHEGVAVAAVVPVTLQFRLHGDTVWLAQAGGALP